MSIVCFCSDQSILMTFLELVQPRPIKLTSNTFHSSILFVHQTSDFPEKLSSAFKSSQCVKTTSKRYKSSLFLPVISLKICFVNMLLKFIVGHNWSSSLRELIFKSGQPTPVQQPFRSQVWRSLRVWVWWSQQQIYLKWDIFRWIINWSDNGSRVESCPLDYHKNWDQLKWKWT